MSFVASLHTHVRSIFDAYIDAQRLCDKIKELGGKGCAVTDHGVLTSIEDYRRTFAANGLKFVPGVEVYVDGGLLGRLHLVLLATNDRGYKGISKIVTKSNSNVHGGFYPMVTKESLKEVLNEYKGDIIALSACMQGVISAIYLLNGKVEREIEKIHNKQAKYLDPSSPEYVLSGEAVKEATEELEKAIRFRDEVKELAERKFAQREKAVAKSGTPEDKLKLEADKVDTRRAQEELPKAKAAVNEAKKALSKANKNAKAVEESVEKYLSYEEEIIALQKELKTDDELSRLAEEELAWYLDVFGKDNFYAEIQYHRIEEEAVCFPRLALLARKHGVSLVATNDVHILENTDDERLRRQILRSLRFGKEFESENDGDSELYLKDNEELSDILLEIFNKDIVDEAIKNIEVVFDRCNVEFKTEKHYPKFAENSEEVFDAAIEYGKKWRFPEGMDKEHEERLAREIQVIKSMGYVDYHLVVKDFLEYARLLGYVPKSELDNAPFDIDGLKSWIEENGWSNGGFVVGPGRGSAVGSLVCYLLGITALDPLDYGLYFERFLNPERVSMPDIDSDISATTRPYVIAYCQNKYGFNAVCGVLTVNALAPRGCINAAAKYYGLKYYNSPLTSLGRQIAKEVTGEVGVKFSSTVAENGKLSDKGATLLEYLNKKYAGNRDALEIIKWATVLEGSFTAYGAHAAGIVISDNDDISEYLPLRANEKLGLMTSQCNKEQVEEMGLLKFDLLGLKTLDIITETLRMVEKNYGEVINPLEINREDMKVFELLTQGKTNAVFQFESAGMKAMLKRFKPQCFEDLIILVSMFRPGPLQYLDGVIDVKNGKKTMSFLCKQLEPITSKTYGAIVYQEQVMEICQSLAGFTLGHADEVRRFMSKKKAEKLAHERESFVEGCAKNDISKEIAEEIFKQMMDFASYAFNKSHATAYAFNAYITAWLKVYYPAEFFAAALNWTTSEKLSGLMYEANACGVKVLAPDINLSEKDFSVTGGVVRFGLGSVAGVKDGADEILKEREKVNFTSLTVFLTRCNPNSRVVSHLIDAGAFDSFSDNRLAMKKMAEEISNITPTLNKKLSFVESAKAVLPYVESSDKAQIIEIQQNNGLKVEIAEPTTVDKLERRIENAENAIEGLRKELSYIKEARVEEDKVERLKAEKELLGMYVSEHPMKMYPPKEEVSPLIEMVADMDVNTCACYGIVTNLQLKARKSDGATMAFFDLEDASGSIKVSCFTKAYPAAKNKLVEGTAVFLKGHCIEEESYNEDGGVELAFVMDEAVPVTPKKSTYFMSVSSYASFHLDAEECFMEEYTSKDGHELLIYDKSLDEVREVPYKVRDEVLKMPCVREM